MIGIRLLVLLSLLPVTAHADYSAHAKAPELLSRLSADYGFNKAELETVRNALKSAQRLPQLVEREQKAPEKTETWTQYVRRVDDARVQGGVTAIREHAALFARAESEFGVPPAVVAAILGIETRYGRITGSVRVLDALATQGFDHPTRTPFFFSELTEYFAFCRDFGFAPDTLKGSYAGAMGAAQFMPSNYRRLALDYDGDHRRDLWQLPDAIGSIANYFIHYRPDRAWRRGEPLAVPATRTADANLAGARFNDRDAFYRVGEVAKSGLIPGVELPADQLVGLIELPLDDGSSEYWLGLPNFYSVMTYNPRIFYAMAVTQLAMRIETALAAGSTP